MIELYLVNCILELLLSILSKRFRCSNESNQKAIRDRSSKVQISWYTSEFSWYTVSPNFGGLFLSFPVSYAEDRGLQVPRTLEHGLTLPLGVGVFLPSSCDLGLPFDWIH